jgi:ABC-type amino acid transport substrate-binding protein
MNDILAGDIVAFVDEWPVLRYLAHHEYAGEVSIVPQTFSRGFVGFALPLDSPRRRQLNVALLEVLGDPAWQELTRKYLGQ